MYDRQSLIHNDIVFLLKVFRLDDQLTKDLEAKYQLYLAFEYDPDLLLKEMRDRLREYLLFSR